VNMPLTEYSLANWVMPLVLYSFLAAMHAALYLLVAMHVALYLLASMGGALYLLASMGGALY